MAIALDKAAQSTVSRLSVRAVSSLVLKYAALLITLAVFLVPMFWMLSASLKDLQEIYTFPPQWIPATPRWSNYVEAWNAAPFGRFYVNTIITTSIGVAAEVILGTLT